MVRASGMCLAFTAYAFFLASQRARLFKDFFRLMVGIVWVDDLVDFGRSLIIDCSDCWALLWKVPPVPNKIIRTDAYSASISLLRD